MFYLKISKSVGINFVQGPFFWVAVTRNRYWYVNVSVSELGDFKITSYYHSLNSVLL